MQCFLWSSEECIGERYIRHKLLEHSPFYRRYIKSLQEVDGRLVDRHIAHILLHELMQQGQVSSDLLDIVDELIDGYESSVCVQTENWSSSSNTSFTMATNILMKLNTEVNVDIMIQVELAKAFLHTSMDNTDVGQGREDCLAHVYLASL